QVSALTSSLTSPAPLISFPTPTPPSAIYTLSLHDALPISQLNLFQFPFAFRDHVLFASVTAKHQCLLLKEDIDASLLRRQKGHGRGKRMEIEKDLVERSEERRVGKECRSRRAAWE